MTFFKNVLAPIVGVGIIAGILASEVLPLIGTLFFIVGGGYFMSLLYNKVSKLENSTKEAEEDSSVLRQSLLESKSLNAKYEAMISRLQEDSLKDKEVIHNLRKKVDEYIKMNDLIYEQSKPEVEPEPEVKPKTKATKTTKTVKKSTK